MSMGDFAVETKREEQVYKLETQKPSRTAACHLDIKSKLHNTSHHLERLRRSGR
jgi:hypothetical protein